MLHAVLCLLNKIHNCKIKKKRRGNGRDLKCERDGHNTADSEM